MEILIISKNLLFLIPRNTFTKQTVLLLHRYYKRKLKDYSAWSSSTLDLYVGKWMSYKNRKLQISFKKKCFSVRTYKTIQKIIHTYVSAFYYLISVCTKEYGLLQLQKYDLMEEHYLQRRNDVEAVAECSRNCHEPYYFHLLFLLPSSSLISSTENFHKH